MFRTKVVEKIKTHILCSVTLFFFSVCEIMPENIVEPGKPQATIWCMRIAYWMPRATNTHPGYVILNTFPQQQWLQERPSVLGYAYMPVHDSCFSFIKVVFICIFKP